ncbi:MAG: hypothetical protein J7K66_01890 [Anaerolineaceae bacterium]|nr:hypothetical protein [Anaerolineaceae bacterium]
MVEDMEGILLLLKTISNVITAGVAIISFSLFMYVIGFKLRDRVTRSFTFLLACIVVIFGADVFASTTYQPEELLFILRIQYIGLILLPTSYFYFSDALLTITGKPSRGKRRVVGYVAILFSALFCVLLFNGSLFSEVIITDLPAPHIERTISHDYFSAFYVIMMIFSGYNFIRSLNRTSTRTSRRRMVYLIISAIGPALGSFPYLMYGTKFASNNSLIFWLLSIFAYLFVSFSIVGMTYTVSFFGFPWPDRVVKSRLFRWIMRGPITASLTLGVTIITLRIGTQFNVDVSSLIILEMVATIVVFEYFVTIFSPVWERLLFNGSDREELAKIRTLEDRLLTKNDLEQFLELILATLCDRLQINGAKLFENRNDDSTLNVMVGNIDGGFVKDKSSVINKISKKENFGKISTYQDKIIIPIVDGGFSEERNLLGFIATKKFDFLMLDDEKKDALMKLIDRAAAALQDRRYQDSLLTSLEILTPQVTAIQNILASSRFDKKRIINEKNVSNSGELEKWVREALNHFFGGPKLSQSPLLQLTSVQKRILEKEESSINALREVLREAIKRLRPLGKRQYTNEWILFNILDLKFIDGWKVKDISRRLSLSEADFYRKQRIAIAALTDQIIALEKNDSVMR